MSLARILFLAAQDEEDACTHLSAECPWFLAVQRGDKVGDFRQYCQPAGAKALVELVSGVEGGPVQSTGGGHGAYGRVALTPRTPEASTVDKPTVPPGGPGLFHIKGRHLPPYIQHLWHHLAPKYGKQRAYGMAVGVVKKWAAGVNPGGWPTKSGKGKRTHPDVRAAAARNVAEWERDKADAHKQSAERRAGRHG